MGRAVVLVKLVMVVVVVLSVRSQSRSRCGGWEETQSGEPRGCVDTGMAAHRQCMEPLHCDLRECHVTHVRVWFGGARLQTFCCDLCVCVCVCVCVESRN